MTNYVWAEWMCLRCEALHRMKFQIRIGFSNAKKVKGILPFKGLYIEDHVAIPKGTKSATRHGSRIYVKMSTTTQEIIEAIREFMQAHYAIREDSLTLEICRE